MRDSRQVKGFTLIELLVVIAIVAILAAVVIITLNPAELLRQARDSNRVNDLSTLKSAISLYLADGNTSLDNALGYAKCYTHGMIAAGSSCTSSSTNRFGAGLTNTTSSNRYVNGTGWLPVNFAAISSGSPIGQLPADPVSNSGTYFYAYAATSTDYTFEVNAQMESKKYSVGGSSDVASTDGGNSNNFYEVGTRLDL